MNISGKLHDWQVFLTVVELGSFSAAAKHMGISVSTVSKQISRLEKGVDSTLINRDTHNLHLTEAGNIAYEKSTQVIKIMDDLIANLRNPSRIIQGSIKLTAPALVCEFLANQWLAEYMEINEKVSVFLESRESNQFSKETSTFDHLVLRSGFIENEDFVHRKLNPLHLSLCTTRNYIEEYGIPTHPEELHKHNFLWVHHHGFPGNHIFCKNGEEYIFNKSEFHRYSSDNLLSTFKLMTAGKGICITTPAFLAMNIELHPDVITIIDDWKIKPIPVYLIWRHRRYYSPVLMDLIEFITDKWNNRVSFNSIKVLK